MSKLKVAVVGCGFVAQTRHIPSFSRLKENVFLRAVCDVNQDLASNVAEKFGVPIAYSNLSEMLSEEDLDIVDVCTPPQIHASVAVESMESGCHVLLEKPMASSVTDCDRMIRASQKCGVKLSVVHNQRFYPPFLKSQELVKGGAIGRLTGMRILSLTHRGDYMARENHWVHGLHGGVIGETAPHTVYMSLAFLRNIKNVDVCAKKTLNHPWVLYDDYRIELEGDNVNSSIAISHANDFTAEDVDLFGTEGMIRMDLQSMLLVLYRRRDIRPTSLALSSLSVAEQILRGVVSNAFALILRRTMLGHTIVIERFVNSVVNDQPVPVPAGEGRETVRLMEAIVDRLNQKCGCIHKSKSGRRMGDG